MKDKNWYRLDNAGKVYPAIITHHRTSLFRISATLINPVHAGKLQKALDKTMKRFPYFNVQIQRGMFWYFFETNEHNPIVERDSLYPCMAANVKRNRMYLFRVRAFNRRIAVEFSHILTDGTGALIFLKTLLLQYFRELGLNADPGLDEFIFNPEARPDPGEYEDSFKKVYNKKIPFNRRQQRAFHLPEKLMRAGHYNVVTAIIPAEKLLDKSREYKVSLTEFLTALLIESYRQYCADNLKPCHWKPIVINVPVNLRPIFNSRTMKNFFLSMEPAIDPRLGEYTFDEIVSKVHHYMRHEVDSKVLNQQITRNVKGEMNTFVRLMPLLLKNMVLPIIYNLLGENNYSGSLSNLGRITMPEKLSGEIERFEFIPAPSTGLKTKAGFLSWGGNIYISFGRLTNDSPVERIFFRKMRKMGIPVKIESNY
ncbi:hypothetical protein [Spirochaeta isovalerica]|uniref:Alcohol acetyltransferase n=1 Tax=Spirochaeta isovalerica TaxID=150 RepID=A0A841R8Y2_9SPIO|nr:hypothetical protein [Spirochaeta isovalerica]MBB6479490.1 hypothetical protein [Spirochaeta isovalerica]